jgi:hypothetical protein
VRDDDPELASYLWIEERALEAGGLNLMPMRAVMVESGQRSVLGDPAITSSLLRVALNRRSTRFARRHAPAALGRVAEGRRLGVLDPTGQPELARGTLERHGTADQEELSRRTSAVSTGRVQSTDVMRRSGDAALAEALIVATRSPLR